MFDKITRLLSELFGEVLHTKKNLAACTGAPNMTGRYQSALTRFENICMPGIYRIWCAAHQIDLVIQSLMSDVIKQEFRDPRVALIGCLLRQFSLRNEMRITCPIVSGTWRLSLGSFTRWLVWRCERIIKYISERDAPVQPPTDWWNLLLQ